ncbi:MAG: NAD-dependent epimerase/dehydratase family protein [Bacteroidales bacterium]|nr:NAD-dependent epimerase/dehydratase family protein [Bacteroidales bacterium]
MKIYITGATGFIGSNLTKRLIEEGNTVHALIRNPAKSKKINFENVIFKNGDLLNSDSLYQGMKGCEEVYHLAAFARPWAKQRDTYYKINVQGTLNVLLAAIKAGVRKVVITSTAGVLGPSEKDLVTENSGSNSLPFTGYEKSKIIMEEKVWQLTKKKIQVVIVLPSRLYGPGELTVSNSVTKLIKLYNKGLWRLIPGDGKSIGNYVFITDVLDGLILAMKKGRSGERYIIGGQNLTYNEFFETLGKVIGKSRFMIKIPLKIIMFISGIQLYLAELTGKPPVITPVWVKKYCHSWAISSNKAKNELGYQITPIHEGINKTMEWLKDE